MTILSDLYLLAVLMLAVLAMFFIFCRHYEEGVVGNAALGVGLLMALIELADVRLGTWTAPPASHQWLVIAFALFMARYAAKVVWMNWAERYGWRRPRAAS